MASLGHIAVGFAAGRVHSGTRSVLIALAYSALSMLPDADVIAFVFRIPYAHPFGHRGASHSIAFAVLVGLAAWALSRSRRTAFLVALTVATHPLLDALTDGGLGCALLWPFSNERFFAPVTPLPVAPIGARLASPRGLWVLFVELVAFLPLWVFAWRPVKRARQPTRLPRP